ncbi:MAG: hypothetical protein U1E59_14505 [Amaricoccus sp.]
MLDDLELADVGGAGDLALGQAEADGEVLEVGGPAIMTAWVVPS